MEERHLSEERATIERSGGVLHCRGRWTVRQIHRLEAALSRLDCPEKRVQIDLAGVAAMDTGGAWLLYRLVQRLGAGDCAVEIVNAGPGVQGMVALVSDAAGRFGPAPAVPAPGMLETLGRLGRERGRDGVDLLGFIGEMAGVAARQLFRPARFRWGVMTHELGEAGYKALAIVGLLAFLLGVVITYQGGIQLRKYGASLFVADLVGFSMLRELSPILTAIIVAGRTGSAYTAQIGTMKVTEEVDALRAMGIQPMELLVLPKLVALVIALPLLTVYADIMGVIGGMVMASAQLDIAYGTFIERLQVALSVDSFLVGVGKAPVFAAVIATLGCYQGFRVSGSAESVGRRTTVSVVQSILAVIVIDAAFSVAFSYLGI
jgi:phospholipid/cholesterol/gamma-HCH transport system permease protein